MMGRLSERRALQRRVQQLEGEVGQLLDRLIAADEHIHRLELQLDEQRPVLLTIEQLQARRAWRIDNGLDPDDAGAYDTEHDDMPDAGPELERPTLN